MKTTLTIEQSARLIELGVDAKLASSNYVGRYVHYSTRSFADPDSVEPIFTLTDILSILPKEINYNGLTYGLSIWVEYGEWHVKYISVHKGYDYLNHSDYESPELIDALNSLLIWAITNGHLNTKKK